MGLSVVSLFYLWYFLSRLTFVLQIDVLLGYTSVVFVALELLLALPLAFSLAKMQAAN